MAFAVPLSDAPLVPETLPVLKTRHYTGSGAKVYTMARLYFKGGALQLFLYAFERQPPPGSRVLFALQPRQAPALLLVRLAGAEADIFVCRQAPASLWAQHPGEAQPSPRAEAFAGVDEQGWYWGARLEIPEDALRQVGFCAAAGAEFMAALYKLDGDGVSFGASFPFSDGARALDAACFDPFVLGAY